MSNQQREMTQIRRLISVWISEIRLNNYENYTDINKVAEHLCRQLLNKIYNHELEDLNRIKANFPGLDLGDQIKDMVAYQVTSRTDRKKVVENLETVVKKSYEKTFARGIRFLILNDVEKVRFGPKAKKTPASILPSFQIDADIIYPQDLIKKIEDIYEKDADLVKFNQIKLLLEKELIPIASGKPKSNLEGENEKLKSLLFATVEKLVGKDDGQLNISSTFFYNNLEVPHTKIISPRSNLVDVLWEKIESQNVLWIHGAPATGKTSIAVLLSKKTTNKSLWVECRDIQPNQLLEHIINSLSIHFNISISSSYNQTIDALAVRITPQSLLILNDLVDLQSYQILQQHLGQLISLFVEKAINVIITSNFHSPLHFLAYDLVIESVQVPPFKETDTSSILEQLGASKEASSIFSSFITETTEGHPLLIQSAARYLKEKAWEINSDTITTIFSWKFGDTAKRESYRRVLDYTTDAETRTLLYRLRCVIGEFDKNTIESVSAIQPSINHAGEKLNQIKGIWLQETGNGKFQLSPLIKSLDGNLPADTEKEIYNKLGVEIIKKKNISQIDASKAIFYFRAAEQFNQAAFILLKVLTEFVHRPALLFDWGLDLYWWDDAFPESVAPILKAQIRILQITLSMSVNRPANFLISDLRQVAETEDIGLLGQASSHLLFSQLEHKSNPISSFKHLIQARANFYQLEGLLEDNPFDDELLNGIWLLFSNIHTRKDYEEWFQLFKIIDTPPSITDPYKNSLFAMAGASIYRNAVLKNKETGEDVIWLLHWLIQSSLDNNLPLLSAYSLRYLVKYLIEDLKDWDSVGNLTEGYKSIWALDPLYKFLFFAELGTNFFYDGKLDDANFYFNAINDTPIPSTYTETVDYLIAYMQVIYRKEPEFATELAKRALELAFEGQYLIDDKIKLCGEVAIALTRKNDLIEALNLYEKGYILLLENFTNSDEHKALVIRYGNAVKYLTELLEHGQAISFGADKFVIPETGYFFRTNTQLLEGGFYFDERKFIVAAGLQASFESIADVERAKKWAYKSIELSLELPDGKFIPILQMNLFYLIHDKQFRQAYNVQAYVDNFYKRLKEKLANGEAIEEGLRSSLTTLKLNDLSVYAFILLPIAANFSLDIVYERVNEEQYQLMISEAFSSDRYEIKDPASFDFLKKLFEKIMIHKYSYHQMIELLHSYKGEFTEIFHIICYLLLSSFKGATEAANLQLAIIVQLDLVMRGTNQMYRFCIVPYFIEFWKRKINTYSWEFTGKEHLLNKGFPLIEKSSLQTKIKTLFHVLSDHLILHLSPSISDYIDTR